jgi:hypothetical protein
MSEMVHRLAHILMDADLEFESYHSVAIRLIEAMREPTEAMVNAGYDADNGEDRNLGAKGAREAWTLMIDEALK